MILEGIREPATRDIGFMPAFRHALDDAQIAQLAAYLRQRFAPDKRPGATSKRRPRGCARRLRTDRPG